MGRFAKLDSSLQRGLDNGFAYVFGGLVVPGEVDDLLTQLAEDNVVQGAGDWVEAPNVFAITLSEKDWENLRTTQPSLPSDAAARLSRWCRNQGFITIGPVVVTLTADASLRTGQLSGQCSATTQPTESSGFLDSDGALIAHSPAPAAHHPRQPEQPQWRGYDDVPATPPATVDPPTEAIPAADWAPDQDDWASLRHAPLVTLLLQDGSSRSYVVQEGATLIGRGSDVDFRLPDMGVSRHHAEITWNGEEAVLTDLRSTNGTTVNDVAVDNWLLADGDVIKVGHSYIEVRITSG